MTIQPETPENQAVIADLLQLRQNFIETRLIFVESQRIIPILKYFGATDEDLEAIQTVSDSLRHDPTLPFRLSKNGRFCYDFKESKIRRLEFQPFTLSAEEDFVRHDSGKIREFEEVQQDLQQNSALQALFIFKGLMIRDVPVQRRPMLDYEIESFVCTLFNLRTVTNKGLLGEPALEGVHSDGVDFTMTTFLGCQNMTDDSAKTFVHDMETKNGIRWNEVSPEHTTGTYQHRDLLDTLLFVDHERKHSLCPVHQIDPEKPATRDMLIFFTRKPVQEGHISHPYDSLNSHKTMPMEIQLA